MHTESWNAGYEASIHTETYSYKTSRSTLECKNDVALTLSTRNHKLSLVLSITEAGMAKMSIGRNSPNNAHRINWKRWLYKKRRYIFCSLLLSLKNLTNATGCCKTTGPNLSISEIGVQYTQHLPSRFSTHSVLLPNVKLYLHDTECRLSNGEHGPQIHGRRQTVEESK